MGPHYDVEQLKDKYTDKRAAGLRWVVVFRSYRGKYHYAHAAQKEQAEHIASALNAISDWEGHRKEYQTAYDTRCRVAKLSNRQPGYRIGPDRTQEPDQDGLAPLAVIQLTVVDVTCPRCDHETTLAYGGWTAIVCQGCKVVLYRNRRCKETA